MTSIRRAGTDDPALLAAVAAVTFRLACPPGSAEEDMAQHIVDHLSEERMSGFLADPARKLFVAEDDEGPVGYTMLVNEEPTDPEVAAVVLNRPTAELSKCYVVAGRHGSGVASELIEATVAEAVRGGATSVWLGVNQLNPRANRFYEKHGFELKGPKHFRVGTELHDDWVRERIL